MCSHPLLLISHMRDLTLVARDPEALLGALSLVCGFLLVIMAVSKLPIIAYGGYVRRVHDRSGLHKATQSPRLTHSPPSLPFSLQVLFQVVFLFTNTIAAAQIAIGTSRLSNRRYGLVYVRWCF